MSADKYSCNVTQIFHLKKMKHWAIGFLLGSFGAMFSFSVTHAEAMTTQEAAKVMIQLRDTCKVYVSNGQRFWSGELKRPENAPGLVLLNKEIQRSVRKASDQNAAGEIAWQKCLDVVFNNQNSNKFAN